MTTKHHHVSLYQKRVPVKYKGYAVSVTDQEQVVSAPHATNTHIWNAACDAHSDATVLYAYHVKLNMITIVAQTDLDNGKRHLPIDLYHATKCQTHQIQLTGTRHPEIPSWIDNFDKCTNKNFDSTTSNENGN